MQRVLCLFLYLLHVKSFTDPGRRGATRGAISALATPAIQAKRRLVFALVLLVVVLFMRARSGRSGRSRWTSLLRLLAMALALFVVLLTAEAMLLPSNSASRSLLPATTAAPVSVSLGLAAAAEATANALALLSSSAIPPRPESLSFSSGHGPPNISVVVPCYGHVKYLEESLSSVVRQRCARADAASAHSACARRQIHNVAARGHGSASPGSQSTCSLRRPCALAQVPASRDPHRGRRLAGAVQRYGALAAGRRGHRGATQAASADTGEVVGMGRGGTRLLPR
eukprot:scaffold3473_cov122-Isochrysis_galbana.AAC.16